MRLVAAALLVALALTGCSADGAVTRVDVPIERASGERGSMVPDARKEAVPPTTDDSSVAAASPLASTAARRVQGVDVSHHQGSIDWVAVRGDRIEFAYLKASEGTGFVDPQYDANRTAALEAGLQVGSYHYFSQCTEGLAQAEHFVEVIGDQSDRMTTLAPAVDLELDASCATPPNRAEMLAEVEAFISEVEDRTGRRVVVYSFPSFERRYDLAEALDRRLWVRDLDQEPKGNWWMWQRSQTATVAGIDTPVDLNVRRD